MRADGEVPSVSVTLWFCTSTTKLPLRLSREDGKRSVPLAQMMMMINIVKLNLNLLKTSVFWIRLLHNSATKWQKWTQWVSELLVPPAGKVHICTRLLLASHFFFLLNSELCFAVRHVLASCPQPQSLTHHVQRSPAGFKSHPAFNTGDDNLQG